MFVSQESELIELRETIEMLKAQNSAAQAAIQGALNGPDHPPKGIFRNIAYFIQCNSHLFYLLIKAKLLLLSDIAFYNE